MADIDQRIKDILSKMLEKTSGQVLTAAVAIKVLEAKFKEAFGGINFADKTALIEAFLADHQKAKVPAAAAAKSSTSKKGDSSSSNSSDSDSSGSDDDSDDEEEEDEEDEDVFDDSGDDEEEEEPAAKKLRAELLTGDAGARVEAMLNCARKCGYRPKPPVTSGEGAQTSDEYLSSYLVPFFEGKGMDPTKVGEADIKRYRKAKEVAELERDGANLALDRTARRGRGVVAPPAPAAPKPIFMDDE